MFLSSYCITKHGVEAFSDVLRLEMARFNVNVSIIEPGNFIAATSIQNTSREISRKFWDQLAEPIRKDYGDSNETSRLTERMEKFSVSDDIFEKLSISYEDPIMKLSLFQVKDTRPVLNAIENALIRRYPKSRYLVASLSEKVLIYIYQFFPVSVYTFLLKKMYAMMMKD